MLKSVKFVLCVAAAALSAPGVNAGTQVSNNMANCRQGADGTAVLVRVQGFRQSAGRVRVQSYPGSGWLERGAWLHRVDIPVRGDGRAMNVCLPLPGPGAYGIAVRHDENNNDDSDWNDGGGFSRNPDISFPFDMEPRFNEVAFNAGAGVTTINVVLNYRQGMSIEPIG